MLFLLTVLILKIYRHNNGYQHNRTRYDKCIHFFFFLFLCLLFSRLGFLHTDTGIHGDDLILVGQERIDVYFLDFGGETEQGGEADYDLGIALLVDAGLSARALNNLIGTQGANHAVSLGVGEGGQTAAHVA